MTNPQAQLPVQLAPTAPQEEGVRSDETGGRLPSNEPKLHAKRNQKREVHGPSLTALLPSFKKTDAGNTVTVRATAARGIYTTHRKAGRQDQVSDPAHTVILLFRKARPVTTQASINSFTRTLVKLATVRGSGRGQFPRQPTSACQLQYPRQTKMIKHKHSTIRTKENHEQNKNK